MQTELLGQTAGKQALYKWRELVSKDSLRFYLFISPWILGFLIFTVRPMIMSVYYSFTKYKVILPPKWVGLVNYKWLFTSDLMFKDALMNSFIITFLGVPLGTLLSLFMAVVLHQKNVRGLTFWRALFYVPSIMPGIASVYMFAWLFNYRLSPINGLLDLLELPAINFFSVNLALGLVLLIGLWGFGGGMIILLAALQGIPRVLYEAAAIDGANRWKSFLNITLPGLSPALFFLFTGGLIGSMQAFQTGWFLIQYGAPQSRMIFLGYLVYNNAFGGSAIGAQGGMGYASAVAWVIFWIVMALTAINLWGAKHWVYYEQL